MLLQKYYNHTGQFITSMPALLKKNISYLLLTLLAISWPGFNARAGVGFDRQRAETEQLRLLSQAASRADSLTVTWNLFDIALGTARRKYIDSVWKLARETNDTTAILEAARQRANQYMTNDSVLDGIRHEIGQYPESNDRNETLLFVDMLRIRRNVTSGSDRQVRERLSALMEHYDSEPPVDTGERVRLLYALCLYLERTTHGELLGKYLDRLDGLLSHMHLPNRAVRNLFYTHAAIAYARNDNYARVIDIDRKMLATMDTLREYYRANGRVFKNYQTNRYSCYRRLLGSYPLLTRRQIDNYYDSIKAIASENRQVAYDLQQSPRATIYYLMATGRPTEALPLLRQYISPEAGDLYRRQLLEAAIEAADAAGDNNTQLQASMALNKLLRQNAHARSRQSHRELQLFNDLAELRAENSLLEAENTAAAQKSSRRILIWAGISLLVLSGLLLLLFGQYRRARQLTEKLANSNKRLRQERDNLRHAQQELIVARDQAAAADRIKTDFVNSVSHEISAPLTTIMEYTRLIVDCIPPEKAKYLERFANTVNFNARMVLSLVKEVLDVAAIDNDKISIDRQPVSVHHLCSMAADTIFEGGQPSNPNIKAIVNPEHKPDTLVLTDCHRAVQVLMNLLANAEKFTDKGTVTLDYETDNERGEVRFSVTDTGSGIPEGMEDVIFLRFRQLDTSRGGIGLGLHIVRRLTGILGGKVWVDTSWRRGARFILSLPMALPTPRNQKG